MKYLIILFALSFTSCNKVFTEAVLPETIYLNIIDEDSNNLLDNYSIEFLIQDEQEIRSLTEKDPIDIFIKPTNEKINISIQEQYVISNTIYIYLNFYKEDIIISRDMLSLVLIENENFDYIFNKVYYNEEEILINNKTITIIKNLNDEKN